MEKSVFKEKQYFHDNLVIIFLIAGLAAAITGLIITLVNGHITLLQAVTYAAIIVLLGFELWWLTHLRLKISVNQKQIKFKMTPLQSRSKKIAWEDVDSLEIVKTPKIARWFGGNMRFSGEHWFSLTGRNGILLRTKDGKTFFIGCEDVDGLSDVLDNVLPAK